MADLKTNYLGIELKNPVIVGASNLVTNIDNLKRIEDAGAAAVVYKSLFEEQIQLENLQMFETMDEYSGRNAEGTSLFPNVEHAGPEEHLMNLVRAKNALDIPVFASLNAVNYETWIEYSKKIEQTGVDGLEINFYSAPTDFELVGKAIIHEKFDIIEEVKKAIDIPVAVKLSPFYTNPLNVINEMDKRGADGFVLFNKLFQPEIDIDEEKLRFPYNLSNIEDSRLPLRFAGLLYDKINADICSSRGVFTGEDVISMILAGADCVQVVSTIYKNGIDQIRAILTDIDRWMDGKNYKKLSDFRGKMSKKNIDDHYAYRRAQYVDILMKSDVIFKKYPTI